MQDVFQSINNPFYVHLPRNCFGELVYTESQRNHLPVCEVRDMRYDKTHPNHVAAKAGRLDAIEIAGNLNKQAATDNCYAAGI